MGCHCGGHTADDVRKEPGVRDLLVGHELDEVAVFGIETGRVEIALGELSQSVMEQVKFDVFLVERQAL